jgi:hypothetical protein
MITAVEIRFCPNCDFNGVDSASPEHERLYQPDYAGAPLATSTQVLRSS